MITCKTDAHSDNDDEQYEPELFVRIRGLPWQATRDDILNFFYDCKIKNGLEGIHMTLSKEGRPSGEAYVELETEDDYRKALDLHKKHMGTRYIEVFPSKLSELFVMMRRNNSNPYSGDPSSDGFVRLRGLPFGCKKEDISAFFEGLEIVRDGIVLPMDHHGRATGEAYVQFANRDIAEKAMGKHKEKIGHRYIEIFKSSSQEFFAFWDESYLHPAGSNPHLGLSGQAYSMAHGDSYPPKMRYNMPSSRPSPYGRNHRQPPNLSPAAFTRVTPPSGSTRRTSGLWEDNESRGRSSRNGRHSLDDHRSDSGQFARHTVHMRGLPYKATEMDIFEFFKPVEAVSVNILHDVLGRSSGEADVVFATHEDALQAMNKNKANMQHRYIELFLHSTASPPGSSSGFIGPAEQRYLITPAQAVSATSSVGIANENGAMYSALGNLSLMRGIVPTINYPIQTAIDHRLQTDAQNRI